MTYVISNVITLVIGFTGGIAVGLSVAAFLFLSKTSGKKVIYNLGQFLEDKGADKPAPGIVLNEMTPEELDKIENPDWAKFNAQLKNAETG